MTLAATGADTIVRALADYGVTTCFANPGTSEMHLVAALGREPRLRPILCLAEGVATGAADGFARIAGRPAATLLHLGPGYSNGAANLHNARRAFSPIVNLVGDHATTHAALDAPLTSDIANLASTSSIWVHTIAKDDCLQSAVSQAVDASLTAPCGPATLIIPADCSWGAARPPMASGSISQQTQADDDDVTSAVVALRQANRPALLLGTPSTACPRALAAASRLNAAGIAIYADTFVARQLRGGNHFAPTRIPYFAEDAHALLAKHDLLLLAGTAEPVPFFAYPKRPNKVLDEATTVLEFCRRDNRVTDHLETLAMQLGIPLDAPDSVIDATIPPPPEGRLTAATVGISLCRHMSADTIVSDDAVTASGPLFSHTADARPHDWLSLTGGAIGQGLPGAVGAAIARPNARVIALTGDGAAMYTSQAMWTIAREKLDVTIIVFANRAYRILEVEYQRTGSGVPSVDIASLLELDNPAIDWCAMAKAHGLTAQSFDDAVEFDKALEQTLARSGPHLIEARVD